MFNLTKKINWTTYILHSTKLRKLTKKKYKKSTNKRTKKLSQSYVENTEKLSDSNKGKSKNREKKFF